jgi:Protein of unknown function (DUF1320)
MPGYVTVARMKLLSTIPDAFVDEVEAASPGYTLAQLDYFSKWIDAQLAKRYAVPFLPPVPEVVEMWVVRVVTPRVWSKRGVNATDEQWQAVAKDDADARTEIELAANGNLGLYDLPLRADLPDQSGIARGGPLVYAEASPYVWTTRQAERGIHEDEQGTGGPP